MKVLAIDTGAGTSVAAGELLSDEFHIRAFLNFDDRFGHAENIGIALREALIEAQWAPETELLVVANQGPAGYTGLRVGLAAATAYAATRKLSVLGVSSLASAAFRFLRDTPAAKDCSVALEAKRSELFFQRFQRVDSTQLPTALTAETLLPASELPQPLPPNWVTIAADARSVAELGARQWQASPIPATLSAHYLRLPDVTPGSGKRVSG